MLIIRPAEERDLISLLDIAQLAGKGMTSLPVCSISMENKIRTSIESFNRSQASADDYWLIVIEDTERNIIAGTAAIYGEVGAQQAFYAYRIMSMTHHSHTLNKQVRSHLLHLSNDYSGTAEVASLFVRPEYRGIGRSLGMARFALMGQNLTRFPTHVIAEIRGWVDEQGISPVWEAIGKPFFDMSFEEADKLCGIGSNAFITELMPKHPIYTSLISQPAQQALGKPHTESLAAYRLLEQQGFEYDNMVDIFDGGPILRANIANIRAIQNQQQCQAQQCESPKIGNNLLLSNGQFASFRAIMTNRLVEQQTLQLTGEEMAALNISQNDTLYVIDQEAK